MGEFVKGQVVVVPFPFSDLSDAKRRPALIVATPGGDDIILSQITSQKRKDMYAIGLTAEDFQEGGLPVMSYIRPDRLFSADESLVLYQTGTIMQEKMKEVETVIVHLFTQV